MRVLISYLFCTKGGVETALYNRLKGTDRNQMEVDLLFFRDYGGSSLFEDYEGEIIIQPETELIQKKISEKAYDIVISIDSADILKVLHKMDYKGKVGLEVHTTYEDGLKYLDHNIADLVDFVIVPSKYQKNLVQGKIGKQEIYILGNAVGGSVFYQNDSKGRYGKKVILWVGRIDRHKNWRLFLKIAEGLYKWNRDYVFWIVGGLRSEQPEIDAFEDMVYRCGLECVVRWIPQVFYGHMGEIYSIAANSGGCYISTSTNESFGMTVIEAMACRCPVIVNKVGALPELVDDGRGLCVEGMDGPGQIKAIYDFIERTCKEDMLEKSLKYVEENYSSKNIGRKFGEIVRREMGLTYD